MRLFRRRPVPPELSASTDLAVRSERALVALAVHAQQMGSRLDRLEQRLAESEQTAVELPTTEDVLAVRLHSAKVAAELTRVSVELRAEIEKVAASASRRDRALNLAESILDLSDRLDTLPEDRAAR